VRNLVLAASDLFGGFDTLPALGELVRFGSVTPERASWRSWSAHWIGCPDLANLAPGALAAHARHERAASRASPERWCWLLRPLHLIAAPSGVHLIPEGLLSLEPHEADRVQRDFNAAFADSGYELEALPVGGFLATGPASPLALATTDPARCIGARLESALPRGPGSPALRRLAAEVEMWLHEHAVNQVRAQHGRLPVSTLWWWGGGALSARDASRQTAEPVALFSADAALAGLAALAGVPHAGVPADLSALAASAAPRALLALECGSFEQFERRWVAPALEALRCGELDALTVLVSERAIHLTRRDRLKFWRRQRASGW